MHSVPPFSTALPLPLALSSLCDAPCFCSSADNGCGRLLTRMLSAEKERVESKHCGLCICISPCPPVSDSIPPLPLLPWLPSCHCHTGTNRHPNQNRRQQLVVYFYSFNSFFLSPQTSFSQTLTQVLLFFGFALSLVGTGLIISFVEGNDNSSLELPARPARVERYYACFFPLLWICSLMAVIFRR